MSNTADKNVNKFKVGILSLVNELSLSDFVADIKVKMLSEKDVDIEIVAKEEKFKTQVLIQLERKIYTNTTVGIQAVKAIQGGLSVLDRNNCTYKIVVITV